MICTGFVHQVYLIFKCDFILEKYLNHVSTIACCVKLCYTESLRLPFVTGSYLSQHIVLVLSLWSCVCLSEL